MTDDNKTILFSMPKDQFKNLIRETMQEVLTAKNDKELMSFKEVCEYLNISTSSLNIWKSQGKIPFKKLGKRIFFSRNEIISALEESGNYKKLKELE